MALNNGLAVGEHHNRDGNGESGIPLVTTSGQEIEIEAGEVIVKKESVAADTKHVFNGKEMTNCEIISEINESTGGVKIPCDEVPNAHVKGHDGAIVGVNPKAAKGGVVSNNTPKKGAGRNDVICSQCGHRWPITDEIDADTYICHVCGHDNTIRYSLKASSGFAAGGTIPFKKHKVRNIDVEYKIAKLVKFLNPVDVPNYTSFCLEVFDDLTHGVPLNKVTLDRIGSEHGIYDADIIKDLTELTIVNIVRELIAKGKRWGEEIKTIYNSVVSFYESQPNLSHRTNDSMAMQQYSTSAPIAFLAGYYVMEGIGNKNYSGEPSGKTVTHYAYKKGDKVIFYTTGHVLTNAVVFYPGEVVNGEQMWTTSKGYVAENEMLPAISRAYKKKESLGSSYKMFKSLTRALSRLTYYYIEFEDGYETQEMSDDKNTAIEHAIYVRQRDRYYPRTTVEHIEDKSESNSPQIFEPSAGNGMLTVAGAPHDFIVNELSDFRNRNLKTQGYKEVLQMDASKPFPAFEHTFDRVITNPPFGTIEANTDYGYKITSLEHLMAMIALDTMKDNGRAAIIIGGVTEYDKADRIKGGDLVFFNYLYNNYVVDDVINLSGQKLYSRMGTSFNIRLILIRGRKKEKGGYAPLRVDVPVNEPNSPYLVEDFNTLYQRIDALL